jgi:preprotein translocase subunit SecY
MQEINKRQSEDSSAAGRLANYVSLFSGGNLSQSTTFGLGVMPYISSSIIFQLLTTVVPSLEKMQKEGEQGRKRIQEWTRYATVPLCVIQAVFWLSYMHNTNPPLVMRSLFGTWTFWVMGITSLTAGCIFLMWLGEQIDEYGLGNGISLIILAGIVARMPNAILMLIEQTNLSSTYDPNRPIGVGKILFLICSFIFVVAGWYSKSAHQKIAAAGGSAQNAKGEAFEFPKPKKKFVPREGGKKAKKEEQAPPAEAAAETK